MKNHEQHQNIGIPDLRGAFPADQGIPGGGAEPYWTEDQPEGIRRGAYPAGPGSTERNINLESRNYLEQ